VPIPLVLPVGRQSLAQLLSIRQFIALFSLGDAVQVRENPKQSVRVILVDDNPEVLETVGHLLEPDFLVQEKISSGRAALTDIPELEPDIVIIDIALGDMSGFDVVRKLHRSGCRSKFIVMSVHESLEMVRGAFAAGASGYVYKSRIASDLVAAIEAVAHNGTFNPAGIPLD
jgi:DNA-binding NarL/FixJ family response regulator